MMNTTTQPTHCSQCGEEIPSGALCCANNDLHPLSRSSPSLLQPSNKISHEELVFELSEDETFNQEKTQVKASPTARSVSKDLEQIPEAFIRPSGSFSNKHKSEEKPQFVVEKGAIIGEYVLEKKIGEGGMGEIWLGSQPLIGKEVALKILRPKMAYDKEAVARFVQEARSVNAIKHKGLIDIFSFSDLPDGRPYFVMEYLEGESLAQRLSKTGPMPWFEILEVFSQVCRALGAAHERGIVHRDLKSENLFLVKEPEGFQLKLLDFGIAKLSDTENAQLTQAGDIFGTPAYMSPEHCRGQVDQRSDIYSLGVILYETITGRTPFYEPGAKVADILGKQLYEDPFPPSVMVMGRKVPSEVDRIVLEILSKDPDERPQSCEALGLLLQKTLGPLALADKSVDGAKPIFDSTLKLKVKKIAPKKASRLWLWTPLVVVSVLGATYTMKASNQPVTLEPTTRVVAQEPTASTKPQLVSLHISSTPLGADIFLGTSHLGKTPLKIDVTFSDIAQPLRVSKEGFESKEELFTANNPHSFTFDLPKIVKIADTKTIANDTKLETKPDPKPNTKPNPRPDTKPTPKPEPKGKDSPPKKCDPTDENAICRP
jgi:serine/threonine protein kinase